MYLRLAFSIMAHLEFEVYLFDEVMSVGDAEFNFKTKLKFQELLNSNKTIIFVSHNFNEIDNLNRYFILNKGEMVSNLSDNNLLENYLENVFVKNKNESVVKSKNVFIESLVDYKLDASIKIKSIK
jgi:ABC-type polysaccharide/polyol phosphate transport system ATPase subunit